MDFIRNQFARIGDQLNGLSASQKFLAGALVVIMAMTLVFWAQFAGTADMVPFINRSISAEELSSMDGELTAAQIPHKLSGGTILVSAENRLRAYSVLGLAGALPTESKSVFEELVLKNASPFQSNRMNEALLNQARQRVAADAIRMWPGVKHVVVQFDAGRDRGFGGTEPAAAVSIQMKDPSAGSRKLAETTADFVSGVVAHLRRENVKVAIGGRSYPVRSRDGLSTGGGDDWLESTQASEAYHAQKVRELFSNVEPLHVVVSVNSNLQRKETSTHTPDPKATVSKPLKETTDSEESKTGKAGEGEPGVVPNAPLAVNASAAGEDSNSTTTERSTKENMVDFGKTDIKAIDPGGDAKPVRAVVRFPRSYFVRAFQVKTKSLDKEPDASVIDPYIAQELVGCKKSVQTALNLSDEQSVHVDVFADTGSYASDAPAAASAAGAISLALGDHVKEIAVGVLALVSLMMVSNIVKKSAPPPPVVKPAPPPRQLTKLPQEPVAAEAGEDPQPMDAMELDATAAITQQMLDQVSTMVDENPDGAANLVRRWLNQS